MSRYAAVRARTEELCRPLEVEDYVVSSMPDVSPTKWHLAHTSWFFETLVLGPHAPDYRTPDTRYAFLFNSYYVQAGERHCRAQRGLVTRPGTAEIGRYRQHVDAAVQALLQDEPSDQLHTLVELGINHEQQHQELLVMDAKHLLSMHSFRPALVARPIEDDPDPAPLTWRRVPGGLVQVGHDVGHPGFAYDNEGPRHTVWLDPYQISERAVTNE